MVHWGRRSFGVPCGRMVRICALVQCPVRGKLTSSAQRRKSPPECTDLGLEVEGFVI